MFHILHGTSLAVFKRMSNLTRDWFVLGFDLDQNICLHMFPFQVVLLFFCQEVTGKSTEPDRLVLGINAIKLTEPQLAYRCTQHCMISTCFSTFHPLYRYLKQEDGCNIYRIHEEKGFSQ